jgi:hypothetical protein
MAADAAHPGTALLLIDKHCEHQLDLLVETTAKVD